MSYTDEKLQRMLADVISRRFSEDDVLLLLNSGADADGIVTQGLRPLHYAAFEDNVECLKLLVDHGAKVNQIDDVGYTPLHIAAKNGFSKSLKFLLDHNALVNFIAPAAGQASLQLTDDQPLTLAAENDHPDCVELLLLHGADPNRKSFLGNEVNMVPLEHIRCLELLLKCGGDPDAIGRGGLTALMKAAKFKQKEAVRLLLKYGADVNIQCPPRFDQKRAIHIAAMVGDVEIVQMLLDHGALIDRPPDFNQSPLDMAVAYDRVEVCQMLLDRGANPNEINEEGCSLLQVACSSSLKHKKEMIESLLWGGAHPNFSSRYFSYIGPSLSPLVEYLTYTDEYDTGIIKLFLQFGAKVNMRVPTRLLKIQDPFGVLGQIRKLRPYEELLGLLVDASLHFDAEAIGRDSSLSNRQKAILTEAALVTRSLKQLSRIAVRDSIKKPVPKYIESLPVPTYIKNYLVFETL